MNPGSERIPITLTKESENQSWGFRLQGGADFTIPLSVQSVAPGGLAERCGLKAGDAVLSLNERPSDELEHETAKQMIIMSGSQCRLLVQRGAVKVWTPKVTPLAQLRPGQMRQSDDLNGPDPYVQRTSLAADKQEFKAIGSAHNRTARPFLGFGAGSSPAPAAAPAPTPSWGAPPAPANQGYAPPPAPAAQSYAPPPAPAAQTYAPPPAPASQGYAPAHNAGGAGMRDVNAAMTGNGFSANQQGSSPDSTAAPLPSGMRSVRAPVTKPPSERKEQAQFNTCKACGSLCVGVFIRVKGEPMHPECYKCASCGISLKNQGFYTIADKLYCSNCAQKAHQEAGGQAQTVYR